MLIGDWVTVILCCIGTMPSSLRWMDSGVLWLVFFYLILPCNAVCSSCFGEAPSCGGSAENCPWTTGIAANVAAVVAGTAAVIKLDKLLPPSYLRVFHRSILQTLAIISAKPKGGSSFDPNGKTRMDVVKAVQGGHFPREDGIFELEELLQAEEAKNEADRSEIRMDQLKRHITMIQKCVIIPGRRYLPA